MDYATTTSNISVIVPASSDVYMLVMPYGHHKVESDVQVLPGPNRTFEVTPSLPLHQVGVQGVWVL